jgi:enoyl-CoA hydratase/carnithine racemase
MSDLTTITNDGPVGTLTLRRPEARNALSIDLLRSLAGSLEALRARTDLRVVVLTGEGRAFCAGMDLRAVLDDPAAPGVLLRALADVTLALRTLPMVTVAQVNGAAIGGGCGLTAVCDLAVTHADSKMGYPEVDLGVCPAVVAPWLVRKIGAGRARRVLLMGGVMSGQEAFGVGMVDRVVPTAGDLVAACRELASRLASGGAEALRATKGLLNELDGSLSREVLHRAAELSARVIARPETAAILRSRLGK